MNTQQTKGSLAGFGNTSHREDDAKQMPIGLGEFDSELGGALGVAVVGSVLAARTSEHIADGFASASAPCWWIITGCGLVVLAISAATSVQRAGVRLRHAVAQRVVEADTASDQGA